MHQRTPIRPATGRDEAAIVELAVSNAMFDVHEVGDLVAIFRSAINGTMPDHRWWVSTQPDGIVIGAAYVAPEPFADRLWNLYFLAVTPTHHGSGAGTDLIEHVEQYLRSAGSHQARVLIVETSGTAQYTGARRFYQARQFEEEARIRDFYGPGDDKVVFWKALTTS